MIIVLRICILAVICGLVTACNSTGTSSSVSSHIDYSNRSVMAYANGLNSKPVKRSGAQFLVAHSKVQISCFKPRLTQLLKRVEAHYGKKVIITSGYRSKSHNRRVRGARKSQHLYCNAADIRVPGVGKHTLAKFARSLPGIGGVGIYCRSSYVHLDIGKRRNWYQRCGKKRRRSTKR